MNGVPFHTFGSTMHLFKAPEAKKTDWRIEWDSGVKVGNGQLWYSDVEPSQARAILR